MNDVAIVHRKPKGPWRSSLFCSVPISLLVLGLFYITNSNNFFADNVVLQVVVWLLVAGLVWVLTHLRQSLAMWRTAASAKAV